VKFKRGDFCSSIFQSSKLSKISISNSMSNTESFMKQNDLFNNSHSRQLTSVPFMEVKPGTVYLEQGNNTKLSQESTSSKIFHSKVGSKAKFKKYTKTTTC
jgi:succinylglutamate desuccinylase